ncbi:MAG: hypothetical protein CMD98_06325 [Gammaproteobacteria bacterium]|nr:hypothetical protein [Gammaproteobacteria bacterium]
MELMERGTVFVEYLDIPTPPTYKNLKEVEELPNHFQYKHEENFYSTHYCELELKLWLMNTFPEGKSFNYQRIGDGLPVHTDVDRNECINYLIRPGGEQVETVWFDDNYQEIHRECIEPNRWHKLKVDVLHTVEGVTDKRLSITVGL